jgi:hypothetical protein
MPTQRSVAAGRTSSWTGSGDAIGTGPVGAIPATWYEIVRPATANVARSTTAPGGYS